VRVRVAESSELCALAWAGFLPPTGETAAGALVPRVLHRAVRREVEMEGVTDAETVSRHVSHAGSGSQG
jgi:hypothetical protein